MSKKIYLVLVREYNERTGEYEDIVSHGIDEDMIRYPMSQQPILYYPEAKYDFDVGMYYID